MFKETSFSALKIKLANYGAIRPQAWSKIQLSLKEIELKADESFTREIGALVYVSNGLLKEYDSQLRKKPSIVNFIGEGNFLYTTKHNQARYLKAIGTTKLIHINLESMIALFTQYNELKFVFDGVTANYESGIAFRQLILEESSASKRISLFIDNYRSVLPYLKRKEIANYIHVAYDYFIRMYGKML